MRCIFSKKISRCLVCVLILHLVCGNSSTSGTGCSVYVWQICRCKIENDLEPEVFAVHNNQALRSEVVQTIQLILNTIVVILIKATKVRSQNRICLKQQQFLKIDKSESFLGFYIVYKVVCLKIMR